MAIVKRLTDYASVGGTGGYGVEGYKGLSQQQVNSLQNQFLAAKGGQGSRDKANEAWASEQMNKILGIQTAGNVMGVDRGFAPQVNSGNAVNDLISGMNVVTPNIAKRAMDVQTSKEAKAFEEEKRKLDKVKVLAEMRNEMLKTATDAISLDALKKSKEYTDLNDELNRALTESFKSDSRQAYLPGKGNLTKARSGDVLYSKDGKKYTLKSIHMDPQSGQPKWLVENEVGEPFLADPDDLSLDKPSKSSPWKATGERTTKTGKVPIIQ